MAREERHVGFTGFVDWRKLTQTQLNAKLLWACTLRNYTIAHQALKQGAEINCRRADFMTSLHIVTEHGDIALIRLLCERPDIKLDMKTVHGLTPLHTAAVLGYDEVVEQLLQHGAEPNCADNLGRRPLHYAAMDKNIRCAQILLENGALVDVVDTFNETPLHVSVLRTLCKPMMWLLIEKGASVTPTNTLTLNLLLESILKCRNDQDLNIIKYLLQYGNVNSTDSIAWRTPLHIAVVSGNKKLIKYLINNDIDLSAKNRANKTASDMAQTCHNIEIARMIEDKLEVKKFNKSKTNQRFNDQ